MSMSADSDGRPRLASAKRVVRTKRIHATVPPRICEEDHDLIQTVFTCHGNLTDPDFPERLKHLLDQLSTILSKGEEALMNRVKKVEPWNSVRVTLSIPREAAARLRALAAAGDAALQALGILSVQVDGDQVISLRLAAQAGAEPQEIHLRTNNAPLQPSASTSAAAGPVSALLQAIPGPSGSGSGGFKSPNVVAPVTKSVIPPSPSPRSHSGPSPFPFTSMTHAAQTHARQDSPHHNFTPPAPPPPYTTKSLSSTSRTVSQTMVAPSKPVAAVDTTVSLASPLLVNLLQTEGKDTGSTVSTPVPTASPRPRPQTTPRASAARVPPTAVAATPPPPRPSFVTNPEVSQPRSIIQGYSQFTAASSKPCTPTDSKDVAENSSGAENKKLIINPLTGELEPMPSESSDSEEENKEDPFFCPSSPSTRHSDDNSQEDLWVNSRRGEPSDGSEEDSLRPIGSEVTRRRTNSGPPAPEKIKLRLMLDKPEAQAYKVDLSFSSSARKPGSTSVANRIANTPASPPANASGSEELRVPPLHISLRGRNATVVSNKSKSLPWLLDKDDLLSKLPKKKTKLGSGVGKDGRDITAINSNDSSQSQKLKRTKLKRLLSAGAGGEGERLRLKIPTTADADNADLTDEKLSKKRKDSKKTKSSLRYSGSDGETTSNLKMDSEEWISRTLKEGTLRNSICAPGVEGSGISADSDNVSAAPIDPGEPRVPHVEESDGQPEPSRTSPLKPAHIELSQLLGCKNLETSSKKVKSNLFVDGVLSADADSPVPVDGEVSSVKKPQEIGGKIKSELSSKIDRVSGKLKNDLSKDGMGKRKLDDVVCKAVKSGIRSKSVKKEMGPRVPTTDVQPEDGTLSPAKRRHSGDLSAPESHAQKVKRSSSSDQPCPLTKPPMGNRRVDALSRKIRKDYVIDRLRKEKLGKSSCSVKLTAASEITCKTVHTVERVPSSNGAGTVKVVDDGQTAVVPSPTEGVPESDKLKDTGAVEGSTQGEDSGIESMDALSEKSPNQGESPCRKDEDNKKGQNHDRTADEEGKEMRDNCLTLGNSNQITHPPQGHSVPFESSSRNNNATPTESENTSTKLPETADDGLMDSFELKIREAFRRDEDPSREGLAAKILEGSSKDWVKPEPAESQPTEKGENSEWNKDASPSLDDMDRFRVNPPLYTYAKREDSLSPGPTAGENSNDSRNHVKEEPKSSTAVDRPSSKTEESSESTSETTSTGRNSRITNKSLLEQLLIEIPEDTRRTRSWHKLGNSPGDTPKSSPRPGSPSVARGSPRTSKLSPTPRSNKRPNKRKCSENAAELIKACMGVDEGKNAKPAANSNWKKGDADSSDDEPLSDLARSREQSVEHETKPAALKNKVKQIIDEETRNNNKVGVKLGADAPTRRSGRLPQGGLGKTLRTAAASDVRTVRSTRSAPCQDTCDTGNKRRRTSRDGK